MRKLPKFGVSDKKADYFDFEWPKRNELLQMPEDENPIKVCAIHWQESSKFPNFIGALQLELSNGHRSPIFRCENSQISQSPMHMLDLSFTVRRIMGTDSRNYVSQFRFEGDDQVAKLETEKVDAFAPDCLLEPGEEIIGVYGVKDSELIQQIGFIVWNPSNTA